MSHVSFEMFGIDLITLIIIVLAVVAVFFLLDFIFAGGGMTGAATQCGAAMMGSPYGWIGIVAVIIVILAAFWMMFGIADPST